MKRISIGKVIARYEREKYRIGMIGAYLLPVALMAYYR